MPFAYPATAFAINAATTSPYVNPRLPPSELITMGTSSRIAATKSWGLYKSTIKAAKRATTHATGTARTRTGCASRNARGRPPAKRADMDRDDRPSARALLAELGYEPRLTIYLGSAPGAGKTHRILSDARFQREAGRRVAIG